MKKTLIFPVLLLSVSMLSAITVNLKVANPNKVELVEVMEDEFMCRIDPEVHDSVVDKNDCRIMDFSKHPMKGYILVDEFGLKTEEEFKFWVELALDFNPKAKASKKRN